MSIASEITRISGNIADAYTACNSKGATMPASGSQNSANLATTINSIPVDSGGVPREIDNGVYQINKSSFNFEIPSNVTTINSYALAYAFYGGELKKLNLNNVTTIKNYGMYYMAAHPSNVYTASMIVPDLSKIETVEAYGMYSAFYNKTFNYSANTPVSFDLSSLTNIGDYGLYNAFGSTAVKNINLSGLTTLTGNFACAKIAYNRTLTSINLSNLTQIGANSSSTNCGHFSEAFYNSGGASSTTLELTFPELTAIYCTGDNTSSNGTFYRGNTIKKLYFPKLSVISYGSGASGLAKTSACKNIFKDCSNLTEIHFGAANQSAIEANPGYSTLWGRGAGNATVYFDL